MTRQEAFEAYYADMHDIPVETMQQYRWLHQDGYRLPGIAAAYRNFCAGWDAAESQKPVYKVSKPACLVCGDKADLESTAHNHELVLKDAERYQWLRNPTRSCFELDSVFDQYGVPMDEKIDAAMAKEKDQ